MSSFLRKNNLPPPIPEGKKIHFFQARIIFEGMRGKNEFIIPVISSDPRSAANVASKMAWSRIPGAFKRNAKVTLFPSEPSLN